MRSLVRSGETTGVREGRQQAQVGVVTDVSQVTLGSGQPTEEPSLRIVTALPALSIEGPKAVGKTATGLRRARTIHRLDDPAQASLAAAEPRRLVTGEPPILIDEWQRVPGVWDAVRHAVDEDPGPGRFLLTGSASPVSPPTHSGAGRIVRLRLRPFSLAERDLGAPSVSLKALLEGRRPTIEGETKVDLSQYTAEIVVSGFPAIRPLSSRARR